MSTDNQPVGFPYINERRGRSILRLGIAATVPTVKAWNKGNRPAGEKEGFRHKRADLGIKEV